MWDAKNILVNRVFNEDCKRTMGRIPKNRIDLTVTSPPYFNLRDYSHWDCYQSYLASVNEWFAGLIHITKPGGYVMWNIQETIPNPTPNGRRDLPLLADTIKIALEYDFIWERQIIWNKNTSTDNYFGSYPFPGTPIFWAIHEPILVFRKPGKCTYTREQREECVVSKERWYEIIKGHWTIAPESAKKLGHPAPFPVEIPKRFIEVCTVKDSIVYDPFAGSGSTIVAAIETGRYYIGSELNSEYIPIIEKRIAEHEDKIGALLR